jgi:hypothetical protein
MSRTAVLESAHELHRRPQFAGVRLTLEGDYQIRRAPCGCVNRTFVYRDLGRVSCDGTTHLCDAHAVPDDE